MKQLDMDKKATVLSDFSKEDSFESKLKPTAQFYSILIKDEDVKCSSQLDLKKVNEYLLHFLEKQQQKIAQDLHDSIGQELYSLRLYIDALKLCQKDVCEFNKTLENVELLVETTMQSVRLISKNLNPLFVSENDLIRSVSQFVDHMNELKPGQIEFNYNVSCIVINDESHLIHIYRIIQEFITNSFKHANALKIVIGIFYSENNQLEISIHDDGVGFNMNTSRNTCGVTNILNRLKALESRSEFISSIGNGTQLTFVLDGKYHFTSIS